MSKWRAGCIPESKRVQAPFGLVQRGSLNAAGGSVAASGALFIFAARAATTPFEPACQRQAEPSEPSEPGPPSGPHGRYHNPWAHRAHQTYEPSGPLGRSNLRTFFHNLSTQPTAEPCPFAPNRRGPSGLGQHQENKPCQEEEDIRRQAVVGVEGILLPLHFLVGVGMEIFIMAFRNETFVKF